jgi:hypothetical protein
MHLRKEDEYQSIGYFVRQKLRTGEKLTDTERWAKEWLDQYAKKHRNKETMLYNAYHSIPKYVEIWEERLNLRPSIKTKKAKKLVLDFVFKAKAKELLEKNRFKTLIEFESLKPEEYKMICDWFEKGIELPDYLKGILKYRPTFQEKVEEILGKSINQALVESQNLIFYLFLCYFFMMLMLINL